MGFFGDDYNKDFSSLEAGDKVIATKDVGETMFGHEVDKGTHGVVTEVDEGGFFGSKSLIVQFNNGPTVNCDESDGIEFLQG